MSDKVAAHPELYSPVPDAQPVLNGKKCRACGYLFFPPQSYGCELCGAVADDLEPASLKGQGVLHSFATVHLHQGKEIEAPFTVGLIVLDDGPAVRSILTARTDSGLKIGDRMRAVLFPAGTNDSGQDIVEFRFEKAEAVR